MGTISNFMKIRRDGKIIPEEMTLEQLEDIGWAPDKITRVQWDYEGRRIELNDPDGSGLYVEVIDDRTAVAVNMDEYISIIDADGSLRLRVPNVQNIGGKELKGKFAWFGEVESGMTHCFAVVFEVPPVKWDEGSDFYLLHIDSMNGKLLKWHWTR